MVIFGLLMHDKKLANTYADMMNKVEPFGFVTDSKTLVVETLDGQIIVMKRTFRLLWLRILLAISVGLGLLAFAIANDWLLVFACVLIFPYFFVQSHTLSSIAEHALRKLGYKNKFKRLSNSKLKDYLLGELWDNKRS